MTLRATRSGAIEPAAAREGELLLRCARQRLAAADVARVRMLAGRELDWDALFDLADAHRLTPLLHRHVSEAAADLVPAARLQQLRECALAHAALSLRLAAELRDVIALFSAHAIRALPHKGPVLAQRAYGSLVSRQMGDLDILVRPRDVARVRTLLLSVGYRSPRSRIAIPGTLALEYQHRLEHEQDGTVIELHWTITPRSLAAAPSLDELWERHETMSLLGTEIPTLGAADLLLVLCLHGAKHRWCRLELIASVAELLSRGGDAIDWNALIARAAVLGNLRMLCLGLALAHDLLDAPLPEPVRRATRDDPGALALAASVRETMLTWTIPDPERAPLGLHRFRLRAKERLGDRLRYLLAWPALSAVRMAGGLAGRIEPWSGARG